jgi:hypothetical protein
LFIAGLFFALLFSAGKNGPIELDYHVIPSFFIGVFGIVVAARLTASTRSSRQVLDASPVSGPRQTAALCLACVVPAVAGLVVVLLHRAFVMADPYPDFVYGTFSPGARLLITVVIPVVACAGGPLLGVAVGRWLRFPGAALLVVVLVTFWSMVSAYLPTQSWQSDAFASRLLHLAAPYTAFASGNGDGETPVTVVTSYPGSPLWHTIWTVALCALAVCAGLWRGAEGRTLSRVKRATLLSASLALVALVLAATTGHQHFSETSEEGTTTLATQKTADG